MPASGHFPSKLADVNAQFDTDIAYFNDPLNTTRLCILAAFLANANKLYTNPNTPPNTAPDELGWKELWLLRNNPSTRTKPINDLIAARRKQLEESIRIIINDIPNSVLTTTDRSTLLIAAHSGTHTPAAIPANAPVIAIVEIGHLFAVLSITDPAHPHTQSKPAGVASTELEGAFQSRAAIAAAALPPAAGSPVLPAFPQESDFLHIANTGKFLYKTHFTADQKGGDEIIRARYLNSRKQPGDWSNTITVTVS